MLEIDGLGHVYADGTRALEGVTLRIEKGLFGLLGPNGAGKSTLMRVAATLQAPDEGTIRFDGIDVVREPDRIRRLLGYLPQDLGFYPGVSTFDMLDHLAALKGFRHRNERRELVSDLLEAVRLWDARGKALSTLSGGMRRRFGIAQALIGRPRLVIVDEPTAGLDPEERSRCLDLLAGIGDEAVVILSTHIVADVSDLCPRMAVLAGGRVVSEGVPDDLISRLEGQIWTSRVEPEDLEGLYASLNIISRRRSAGQIIVRVHGAKSPGPSFRSAAPDLEDFFFATLKQSGAGASSQSRT
ncbi:ABC transporter ATP-binding protein [Aureimonas phyllosphaerae]|uniref:ABC-type multidrug transport system ATPase subunit n=1 Tax=Aureimonas phyllosphaerae TaxID=1166078 RepID=A0A7W6C033_9HYPH|nr:ABC transporter ATP-binding protein [Aureimonas phyllosphaerae]MBB3937960.1 ABC-type multidrug transport system ATPase subunit [Aureimonas phyllosphaerae]MBB3961995.1 ABC-type multidrug transport system ATPase subunit [Aureimonas phyllosphaerae]SFF52678.1 ABC-type multidrug transport system, ATPase component [Aureimonas phyllosphaerae]